MGSAPGVFNVRAGLGTWEHAATICTAHLNLRKGIEYAKSSYASAKNGRNKLMHKVFSTKCHFQPFSRCLAAIPPTLVPDYVTHLSSLEAVTPLHVYWSRRDPSTYRTPGGTNSPILLELERTGSGVGMTAFNPVTRQVWNMHLILENGKKRFATHCYLILLLCGSCHYLLLLSCMLSERWQIRWIDGCERTMKDRCVRSGEYIEKAISVSRKKQQSFSGGWTSCS